MRCGRCGSYVGGGSFCPACRQPVPHAKPASLDDWDFCEIKAQMRFAKRMLIPVVHFFQDWCFVAVGRRRGGIFVVGESPPFIFKNWDGNEAKFLNGGGTEKMRSSSAADSLPSLIGELYGGGWEEVSYGPGWFHRTFRRRVEPELSLGMIVDKFIERNGLSQEVITVPTQVVHRYGHGSRASAIHPESGLTVLHMATGWGRVDFAALLLDNGARPDGPDTEGMTPLELAASMGEKPMIDFLGTAQFLLQDGFRPSPGPGFNFERFATLETHDARRRFMHPFYEERDG